MSSYIAFALVTLLVFYSNTEDIAYIYSSSELDVDSLFVGGRSLGVACVTSANDSKMTLFTATSALLSFRRTFR